jgi:hypothetical protein
VNTETRAALERALRALKAAPRYDIITNYRAGGASEEMERSHDGEWVHWEHIAPVFALILLMDTSIDTSDRDVEKNMGDI